MSGVTNKYNKRGVNKFYETQLICVAPCARHTYGVVQYVLCTHAYCSVRIRDGA